MTARTLTQLWPSQAVSDGAGVKIRRSLGLNATRRLDPFLMLDCFGSEQAADYIAGFPPHPHRGFETVTYMLDGHMLHEDHLGNQGHLKSGGVQWMTAGRGIIHSEMPQQESGLMRGFQLWLNLPASEKMQAPAYVDLDPAQIPTLTIPTLAGLPAGIVKVIAGQFEQANMPVTQGAIFGLSTAPLYFDFQLSAAGTIKVAIPAGHNALVYPYEGSVQIADNQGQLQTVPTHHAGILADGSSLTLVTQQPARVILLAGRPIGEPVVQYGPFVMNTNEEIEQALNDYRSGHLTQTPATQKTR